MTKRTLRDDRLLNIASMKQLSALYGDKPTGKTFIEEAQSHIGKLRGKYNSPEHDSQVVVVQWWWLQCKTFGIHEKMLFAIPNGGARDEITARRLRDEGVKSGVHDLFLSVARGPYHGLYVEMKAGSNGPTENQVLFAQEARREGYAATCCWSSDAAISVIKQYLTSGTIE